MLSTNVPMDPARLESQPVLLRRSRSRDALVEATKRLLSKSTVNGFTIDDVVREAGVARGTFYNHFTSIDAVVTHTLSTVQQDLFIRISAAREDSPDAASKLARATATVMCYGYANEANARVLMYIGSGVADPRAPNNQMLCTTLQQGVDEGLFKLPSMDAAVVSVLGICEVGLARMLDLRHEYTAVRQLTSDLCVMTLRCVGVSVGRTEKMAKEAVRLCFDVPLGH